MLKRTLVLSVMLFTLTGCYMVPMALIGPATSGFTTASIIQTTVTTSANFMVKKSTGKSITEHALQAIKTGGIQQSYFPEVSEIKDIKPIYPKRKIIK